MIGPKNICVGTEDFVVQFLLR